MEPHPHSAEHFTSFNVGEQALLNIKKTKKQKTAACMCELSLLLTQSEVCLIQAGANY